LKFFTKLEIELKSDKKTKKIPPPQSHPYKRKPKVEFKTLLQYEN
jgi:hypothetical protein